MAHVRLEPPGGPAISTWTVHCSRCGTAVVVSTAADRSTCGACGAEVTGAGLATVAASAAPAPEDAHDSLVGSRVGPWVLERLLGRGGMGRVYEAREAAGTRRVALKVLADALAADPQFVRRFQREAKVLATLSHPHVVEVLDQGEDHGRLWFAMEYVRGENLRRRLERGPLPLADATRVATEIASALAYAHERGVVHRDLKPENVLLGEDGRVRLADFGLLRLARESTPEATTRLTRTDVILGTYEYMAPEQRRGSADVDGRADVFALGVMLYECLTGRLPLGRFAPASELVAGLPPAMDAVLHQALAPEPKDRPPTAQAFADALRAALAGAPPPRPASAVRAPAPRSAAQVEADEREILTDARLLNHVSSLATLDRVAGWLMLASLVLPIGGLLLTTRASAAIAAPFGVVLVVGGVLLLKQGRRLRAFLPGSREAQLAASALLCLLFPLGTVLGVYGLIVLWPRAARQAFERAQARRGYLGSASGFAHRQAASGLDPSAGWSAGPPGGAGAAAHATWHPVRAETVGPVARDGAGLLPRLLLTAALLWTLFLGLAATRVVVPADPFDSGATVSAEVEAGPRSESARRAREMQDLWQRQVREGRHRQQVEMYLAWSGLGAAAALLATVHAWRRRHQRRGSGLAFAALVLFALDALALMLLTSSSAWLALLR